MRVSCYVGVICAASLALVASLASLGCSRDCGPGTYQEGDHCAAGMRVPCGPGTVEEAGVCVSTGGGDGECGPGTVQRGSQCVPEFPPGVNGSRFITLTLTEPATVASLVNIILGPAVADGRVLILWKPRGVTGDTPPLRAMSFGGGTAVPQPDGTNTYVMSASVTSTATALIASDDTFETAPFTFKFQVIPEASEAGLLRVEQTVGKCRVALAGLLDPGAICTVVGGITQANAENVYIEAINMTLAELLAPEPMTFDCNGDGLPDDCWKMSATFTVETVIVDDELLLDGGV
ncbi:MAG: hypothetical protein HY906_11175 [Deltaproteobacteria bacterium]|nr:hypothetical protein [Deltaproteobacteria bacterium]